KNLAIVIEFLVENHDEPGRLNDLEWLRHGRRFDDAVRQTAFTRHSFSAVIRACLVQFRSPRLKQNFDPLRDAVVRGIGWRSRPARTPPDSGKIRPSVGFSKKW